MTKCLGPHHDFDDFTTCDLTTFTTSRLVNDIETGFTVQKWVSRSITSRESRESRKSRSRRSRDVVPGTLSYKVL